MYEVSKGNVNNVLFANVGKPVFFQYCKKDNKIGCPIVGILKPLAPFTEDALCDVYYVYFKNGNSYPVIHKASNIKILDNLLDTNKGISLFIVQLKD